MSLKGSTVIIGTILSTEQVLKCVSHFNSEAKEILVKYKEESDEKNKEYVAEAIVNFICNFFKLTGFDIESTDDEDKYIVGIDHSFKKRHMMANFYDSTIDDVIYMFEVVKKFVRDHEILDENGKEDVRLFTIDTDKNNEFILGYRKKIQ
jgi:poly-beta-hydroxyalkanoate depolymerase